MTHFYTNSFEHETVCCPEVVICFFTSQLIPNANCCFTKWSLGREFRDCNLS